MCRCVRVCRQIAQDLAGHNKGFFFSNLLVSQEQRKGST